jgi:putative ABC transport system permease protein
MSKPITPFAIRLLRTFCPSHLVEEIEGDLLQQFERDSRKQGSLTAKRKLLWNVIRFFRPGILLRNKLRSMNSNMFGNYLKVALRNLGRNKSYSAITIGGMAVGIACSLVIFLFVYGEWSYDKGFKNADRVYRIGISFFNIGNFACGPEKLLEVLPKEFAGIETSTRIMKKANEPIQIKENSYVESVFYADTAYFKIFDYKFTEGSPSKVLQGANEAVITDKMAEKFFGRTNVLGENIEVGKAKIPYTITGVVRAPAFNTHLKSDIWISNHSVINNGSVWTSAAFYSYVLLKQNNKEVDLQAALDRLFENHVYPESGKPMGFQTLEDYKKNEISVKFYIHKLTDIYLKSKLNFELMPGGDESNIYIFSAVSIFILILAAVNFINLSTARASRRAKEVGIRKTLGTIRTKLMSQFLLESIVTSLFAMVAALLLAEIFLRVFEYVTGAPLQTTIWSSPYSIAGFVVFSILVGLISGIYPAFYLTSFVPVKVLKGNIAVSGGTFRSVLVVFQFTVSILLITCALIVQSQMRFMAHKDLGFDQRNVLTIDRIDLLKEKAEAYFNELKTQSGVMLSGAHTGEPGSKRIMSFSTYQTATMDHPVSISTYFGDENFLSLHGMHLIKGRDFIKDLASDSSSIIFNEAAIKALGIQGDPVGQVISEKQKIVGVVSDFHWESLRNSIAPIAIQIGKSKAELGFKLEPSAVQPFLKKAEERWKQLVPDEPFRYHFLDANFDEMLQKERVFEKAINFFTLLSIFISCLGLYGLSAYTTEQRTKEIGIRKVMGASAQRIVVMLSRKFTILILVALIISLPLSVFMVEKWLQGFAYRVELGAGVFVLSIILSVVVGLLAVGYHSIKAALVNPADILKYE